MYSCAVSLQLSATSHVWFATKQSADALVAYVKSKPLWLRDPHTNQELALSVKKSRRPGWSVGGAAGNRSSAPPTTNHTISTSSNSSSSMPMYYGTGMTGDANSQLAQLQASQRLAATQVVDLNMLNNDMIRLLPMQSQQQFQQVAGAGMSAALPSGYMAVDGCEAMMDSMCDNSTMALSMPVNLQPAMAAQVGDWDPIFSIALNACCSSVLRRACNGRSWHGRLSSWFGQCVQGLCMACFVTPRPDATARKLVCQLTLPELLNLLCSAAFPSPDGFKHELAEGPTMCGQQPAVHGSKQYVAADIQPTLPVVSSKHWRPG